MHKTSISLFLGLWFIFNALNPTSVYAAAVGGASSGGSGGSGGGSDEAHVRQKNEEELKFLQVERHRYKNLDLHIITELGELVYFRDDLDELVESMEEQTKEDGKISRFLTQAAKQFRGPVRVKANIKGKNAAIGRINIVLKTGEVIFKDILKDRVFMSGTKDTLKHVLEGGKFEGTEFYFSDSGQSSRQPKYMAINWFINLITNNRKFYEYTWDKDTHRIPEDFKSNIKNNLYHSEQALVLYFLRNLEELMSRGSAASESIDRRDIQCIVIDIVTIRDMCDNCFKTMYLHSVNSLESLQVIFRIIGTKDYGYSRSKREEVEKFPILEADDRGPIPNLNFMNHNLYVREV